MDDIAQAYHISKQAYENAVDLTQTETERVVVLNFKALQLLRIKKLQQELFDLQMRFSFGGVPHKEYDSQLKILDVTLHSYGKALRNYDLLAQNNLDFVPAGSTLYGSIEDLVEIQPNRPSRPHALLAPNSRGASPTYELKNWGKYTLDPAKAAGGNYILSRSLQFRELDASRREARALRSAFSKRLAMALFGGLALIMPMLLMTLKPSLVTSISTTCVATAVFAGVIASFDRSASGKDVLGTTAAYAAVLVVFVGTSMTGQGNTTGVASG